MALSRAVLDRLSVVDDPYAAQFLTSYRRFLAPALAQRPFRWLATSPTMSFLAARTLYFDAAVTDAIDSGVRQVVLVGAGYDSRAWRLAAAGTRFFEVDHPGTQIEKRRRARTGDVTYVAVDLVTEAVAPALLDAGLDPDAPAVFVVEGLTMYLSRDVTSAMFRGLAEVSSDGSVLTANFTAAGGGSAAGLSRAGAAAIRALWSSRGETTHHWADRQAATASLQDAGWQVEELVPGPELARRCLADTMMTLEGLNPGAYCVTSTRRRNG